TQRTNPAAMAMWITPHQRFRESEANERAGQGQERLMNIISAFGPNPELPLRMQPRQRPLHDPTVDPQSAAMLGAAPPEERLDPRRRQHPPMRLRVRAPIAIQPIGPPARATRLTPYRRDGLDQAPQLRGLIDVRGGRRGRQRSALAVGADVVLAPF